MHPKADPQSVQQMREEEAKNRAEQLAAARAAGSQDSGSGVSTSLNGNGRVLPPVSTAPFSDSGQQQVVAQAGGSLVNPFSQPASAASSGASAAPAASSDFNAANYSPAQDTGPVAAPPPATADPQVATYSSSYMPTSVPAPPPGAMAGGLVPPPPAVTLSTSADVGYGGGNPYVPPNPYANPYLNPYGVPYQAMPPRQAAPPPEPKRPKGLFGSGKSSSRDEDDEKEEATKKEVDFVPIRPTGMDSRSAYKQRDDLRTLWSGLLTTERFQTLAEKEKKLESMMKRVPIGLPPDSTKGMFTVPNRRITAIFRPVRMGKIDKKVLPQIHKMQANLVQAYYRYLYTYNKFALQEQTVAAHKQGVEVASTRAEKQRAEADLARARDAAQSAQEDMRSAQYELAAAAGARATRTIIGRVSGVTPNIGALADAEQPVEPVNLKPEDSGSGVLGSVGSFIFGGRDKSKKKKDRHKLAKKKEKKKKEHEKSREIALKDIAPSHAIALKPKTDPGVPPITPPTKKAVKSPISFELKDVKITARKSILSVAIRNSGRENFKFSPDVISISEGQKKISEAAMRAEFDSTLVKPNREVNGKITIFGRPWNDRLGVYIKDGSKNIQLTRNKQD